MPDCVTVKEQDRLAILEISNPPVNILTMAVLDQVTAAVGRVAGSSARGLLLKGVGRHFSAGADIAEHVPGMVDTMLPSLTRAVLAIRGLDIPTCASLHGAALGGGLELAIACDFIFATEDARLAFPEITLGVFPPVAAALLPASMGMARALDLVLSGDPIPARDAVAAGLIHRIGSAEDAATFLARFTRHPLPALVAAKRAARQPDRERLLAAEKIYLVELMRNAEPVEGIRAFIEKRAPSWK